MRRDGSTTIALLALAISLVAVLFGILTYRADTKNGVIQKELADAINRQTDVNERLLNKMP